MNGRTLALTIVGFLIGALAAGSIGVRVIEEVRAEDDATSLPPENVSSPNGYLLDPNQTRIASAAVVPTAIFVSDTSVEIQYDVLSLAPSEGSPSTEIPYLYPRTWTLTTRFGSVQGGPDSVITGVAIFEVPATGSAEDIVSADIVDPLMAYPLDVIFELSEDVPAAAATDRVTVELGSITEQNDSTTVLVHLIAENPIELSLIVEGVGPGWQSTPIVPGSATFELLWIGAQRPEVLALRAVGIQWVELEGVYPVSLEGQL